MEKHFRRSASVSRSTKFQLDAYKILVTAGWWAMRRRFTDPRAGAGAWPRQFAVDETRVPSG